MRVWICWMVSIILLLSAVADVMSRPLPPPPAPATSLTLQEHSTYCHCISCTGGPNCCCKKAHTALQGVVLKARCDNPLPTQLTAKVLFPATLLGATRFPFCTPPVNPPFSRLTCLLHSHTPVPLIGPPRSFETTYAL